MPRTSADVPATALASTPPAPLTSPLPATPGQGAGAAASAQARPLSPTTGVVTVLVTLIGWSSIPLFIKHFSHAIDPWTSNGWRYGFSALIWLPVVLVAGRRGTLPAGLWKAALVPAMFNTAGQVAFAWGFYKIEPGLMTFGMRTQIAFIAVGAFALFPAERPVIRSPWYLLGLLMVASGAAGTILLGQPLQGTTTVGVVLAVSSGLLFASYALGVRKFMTGMNPVLAFAAISQYTAGVIVVLMLALGERHGMTALDLSRGQLGLLLLSSVIGIALGHVFYYISIARLGVAVSSGVMQLQPFIVAVASYFLFGEVLRAGQWLSGCMAVMGAVMMLAVQQRMARRAMRARADAIPR
jgi:drug/metabolite transporter (DMT)-like permease